MFSASRDNRRHFDRFPFSARLEIRLSHDVRSAWAVPLLPADALDVSVSGFGFRSSLPLAVGDVIAVTLPDLFLSDEGSLVAATTQTHAPDPDLEILAVVRHIRRDETAHESWVIGAERAA